MGYKSVLVSRYWFRLMSDEPSRRSFLRAAVLAGGGAAAARLLPVSLSPAGAAPAFARTGRPGIPYGVASGDIMNDRAVVWSRSDRPARMIVEYALSDNFKNARRVTGPAALADGDFTARVDLFGLPAGQDIFYRVTFEDLADAQVTSEPATGRFRSAPASRRDIRFQWSADTAGQGWGINEDWGGMKIYDTMRRGDPDFFIHCGDTIYADNPIEAEVKLADGTVWRNLTTEATSKVAETLAEFRGNFAYNLMDRNVRAFNQEVPLIVQWDDHEVVDNWYPQEVLSGDDRYTVKSAAVLSARARRAWLEYSPVRFDRQERASLASHPPPEGERASLANRSPPEGERASLANRSPPEGDPNRIYRALHYGPSLDVFVIDLRSYRGPNGPNDQETPNAGTALLGGSQTEWLKRALLESSATWKVIASGQPIGLIVYDDWKNRSSFENAANGDGPPRGRELEIAGLLRHIKRHDINNVVWLTADVHYTAAHYYDPDKAVFQDFAPFWEFVSGPLNAGTFGPNELDDTFGPQVMFQKVPETGRYNLPPSAGLQFYGEITIDGDDEAMTVNLNDLGGATLYSTRLEPVV